jgi:hypothetical protein
LAERLAAQSAMNARKKKLTLGTPARLALRRNRR